MEIDTEMLSPDYEPSTRAVMGRILKEGDTFLIGGAHQGGLSSYAAALVGPTGQIYCFEPHEGNRLVLQKTMEPFKNVVIHPYALGDRDIAEAVLFENHDNSGGHSLYNVGLHPANVKTRENPTVQNVQVKTLDSLFEEDMPRLKLCLFDAEGAEFSIIKGGINTLTDNDTPFIICEINDFALKNCGTDQMTIRAFMAMYGYECFVITDDGLMDTNPRKEIACATEEGQAVVFNVLFSRRGKI